MTTFDTEHDTSFGSTSEGDGLPRIWWRYGIPSRSAKVPAVPGQFYTNVDFFEEPLGEPWEVSDYHAAGEGYATERLKILPIVRRSQPYRDATINGQKRREYAVKWEQGMRIHTEMICLIEGYDRPVVFSYKGMAGTAMDGKGKGIIPTATKLLADAATNANRAAGKNKRVGLSAFWVPITYAKTGKGAPQFVELPEGSAVCLPVLDLPTEPDMAMIKSLFAGKDAALMAYVSELKAEYDEWTRQRRTNDAYTDDDNGAAPTGRNVPQPVSEADAEYQAPF